MDNNELMMQDPRPTRADAIQNRAIILETAQLLFQKRGVDCVSMTAIAQEAGVGKGTLYRHFENKTDLCMALLDQDMRQFQEATLQNMGQDILPLEKLRWFLTSALDYVERNQKYLVVGAQEGHYELLHPAHMWWRHTIYKLLEQINPSGDISYISDTLYVMLDVSIFRFQQSTLGYSSERIRDGLIGTLLKLIS